MLTAIYAAVVILILGILVNSVACVIVLAAFE